MKKRGTLPVLMAGAVFLAITFMTSGVIHAQEKNTHLKIGTYDSRIVTFAWSRSEYFREHLALIGRQTDSAEKAHDTARLKEVSAGAMSNQHLLHQMVFSNGSAAFIMALVRDKLPELTIENEMLDLYCRRFGGK
jgi:hypothetical protein